MHRSPTTAGIRFNDLSVVLTVSSVCITLQSMLASNKKLERYVVSSCQATYGVVYLSTDDACADPKETIATSPTLPRIRRRRELLSLIMLSPHTYDTLTCAYSRRSTWDFHDDVGT